MSHRKTDKEPEKELVNEQNKKNKTENEQQNPRKEDVKEEAGKNEKAETSQSDAVEEDNLLEQKEEEINGLRDQIQQLKDQFQRLAAEFDNYKKRTVKEKEKLYSTSVADVVTAFIPVLDNVELALKASEENDQGIRDGVQLIYRQMQDILSNLKIKPIETVGKKFNPEFHEAVMHVEDENCKENEILEEFRKGYTYKDEIVIRHSVVKVAN
jgi:molecular chaperone GrpE